MGPGGIPLGLMFYEDDPGPFAGGGGLEYRSERGLWPHHYDGMGLPGLNIDRVQHREEQPAFFVQVSFLP